MNRILQTYHMRKVEKKYRGTGAVGTLVYLGKGSFVSQSDILGGKALKPGAALQVWGSQKSFEKLKKGQDVHPYGTAAVFVRYVGKDKIKVLHYDREETWSKSKFEVWVGANLNAR